MRWAKLDHRPCIYELVLIYSLLWDGIWLLQLGVLISFCFACAFTYFYYIYNNYREGIIYIYLFIFLEFQI